MDDTMRRDEVNFFDQINDSSIIMTQKLSHKRKNLNTSQFFTIDSFSDRSPDNRKQYGTQKKPDNKRPKTTTNRQSALYSSVSKRSITNEDPEVKVNRFSKVALDMVAEQKRKEDKECTFRP